MITWAISEYPGGPETHVASDLASQADIRAMVEGAGKSVFMIRRSWAKPGIPSLRQWLGLAPVPAVTQPDPLGFLAPSDPAEDQVSAVQPPPSPVRPLYVDVGGSGVHVDDLPDSKPWYDRILPGDQDSVEDLLPGFLEPDEGDVGAFGIVDAILPGDQDSWVDLVPLIEMDDEGAPTFDITPDAADPVLRAGANVIGQLPDMGLLLLVMAMKD